MKIDLHTHSNVGSGCSHQSIEGIVADAKAHGMDAVCLTDHNNMRGIRQAQQLAAEMAFPIFVGMEVGYQDWHILIFGSDRVEGYPPLPYEQLREMIDFDTCALIPAHAYRGGGPWGKTVEIVRAYKADFAALEVYSCNVTAEDSDHLIDLAEEVGLPPVGCGDSHLPGTAGLNYTQFEEAVTSLPGLIAALKSGMFKAVRGDQAWKAEAG